MTMENGTALALSRVTAHFPDGETALKEMTFSVRHGSFVSLIGPSGAGKSTLIRIMLGLMPVKSGDIVRNYVRPAVVFQNYALFPWLTALENVEFGLKMARAGKKERQRIAREKLREVGLEHLENHYPSALSGGQSQRVGLARALAIAPDFLIMDEPFSNLDTITASELKNDLLRIWKSYGMTMFMVNHLIPDAIELSDEIIVMNAHPGRIERHVKVDLPRPRDPRSREFFATLDGLVEDIRRTQI